MKIREGGGKDDGQSTGLMYHAEFTIMWICFEWITQRGHLLVSVTSLLVFIRPFRRKLYDSLK